MRISDWSSDVCSSDLAGRINRGDGQVKNLGSGRDFQNQHDNSFRASLLIEPTHWLKNLTIFDYFDLPLSKNGGAAHVVVATGIPAFQPLVDAQKALGPHRIDVGDIENYNRSRALRVQHRHDLDYRAVTVTNLFVFRHNTRD